MNPTKAKIRELFQRRADCAITREALIDESRMIADLQFLLRESPSTPAWCGTPGKEQDL